MLRKMRVVDRLPFMVFDAGADLFLQVDVFRVERRLFQMEL